MPVEQASVNITLAAPRRVGSGLYNLDINYEHLVDVMLARLQRDEASAEIDPTPIGQLRLKACGMAFQRAGSLKFYHKIIEDREKIEE